ncbi:hypothetical protein FEM48_ZijujUnG0090700 [Ziziphus jujuba var. spinosa]|uniref:Nicotianamine synthase n=1 Tax=Ziziphus jujuba var. spinosa TaxID=714518 RepID=A0A978U8I2_ZIZJJ|nr:hypothetical protein FEM48_ZijujUnG0090700 [Ziziphus jujuba var. spinosa]
MEYKIFHQNGVVCPKKVASVWSSPMPLTSFIMDIHHMKSTHFDNFDIDKKANEWLAKSLLRMKYMTEGGILLVRSAKGARAFLYPVVEEHDLVGFDILSIHPTNDVINSVVLVRKPF